MAKRKQIVKLLDYALEQLKDEYSEHEQVELNDFELGILCGVNTAKSIIKNKLDKKHDF